MMTSSKRHSNLLCEPLVTLDIKGPRVEVQGGSKYKVLQLRCTENREQYYLHQPEHELGELSSLQF